MTVTRVLCMSLEKNTGGDTDNVYKLDATVRH